MSTQRLIGRLDPNTGDVIETDGRRRGGKPLGETSVPVKAAPNKPVKIQQFIPVERKFCGATYLFDAISDKLGLTSDLKSCFPATYKMLLSIAYYLIPEGSAPLFRLGNGRLCTLIRTEGIFNPSVAASCSTASLKMQR